MFITLFQVDVFVPEPAGQSFDFQNPADLLLSPVVSIGFGILITFVLVAIALFILRKWFHSSGIAKHAFSTAVLRVRVPKETGAEGESGPKSAQQTQELIAVMETIFSTLGSLSVQKGMRAWLFGRADLFSFEIVAHRDHVSFYVVVPSPFQAFMEEQIHAQYPNADIESAADYNIFSPTGVVLGSYVKLRRPGAFPIKSYRKLETDPLNSLTNALAKLQETEGGAIQVLVRSAPKEWRSEGVRIARSMQQGKKLSDVTGSGAGSIRSIGSDIRSVAFGKPGDAAKKDDSYRLSPLEEQMVQGLEEKASKAGLEVNIRVVVCAQTPQNAQRALNDILGAFGQFNVYEYGNSFVKSMPRTRTSLVNQFIYRHFDDRYRMVLNAEELASVFHLPLPSTETPKIDWLLSRKALPPSNLPEEGLLLGYSEYRGHRYHIRMKEADRRRHMYIIGKSGSGKSVFQASLIKQDIEAGRGVCVIDPHGDLVDECLRFVPRERAEDVIYFDPADIERPVGLNMLEFDPSQPQLRTFVINELLKIFDKLYDLKSTGGPMFEVYTRNAILLLMEDPASGCTLMDVPRVLADESYRNYKLARCKSAEVKNFWTKEALKAGGESSLANMVPYITSKFASFIYNDYMRPIIGQQNSAFNVRKAMDEGKILLIKLSKGKIGDLNAYLLGMIMVGKILDAALGRANLNPDSRRDFYLYIDEFQNFLTDSINAILSEARKYGLNLVIAHQFIGQLQGANNDTKIRDSIFGNVGTMVSFRIGVEDAEFIQKEFAPTFGIYDLVNVEAYTCNIKLLIDNTASRPFNMHPIMPEPATPERIELAGMIRDLSRYKYGRKRELVEAEMAEAMVSLEEK